MRYLLAALVAVVILLHQDIWNWTDKTLVFGFLPIGLAYHGGYSVMAVVTMAILVRFLWPAHLDDETITEPAGSTGATEPRAAHASQEDSAR
ncbi:MAG: DUF3311 domain-containing protein [Capsulimonadales bacterium]|nr:DUF3311 domain-containing protein [Capsulimonadales bacterium]